MARYIDKDVVMELLDSLVDHRKYREEYECAFRDGNNGAIDVIKWRIDNLEVYDNELKSIECITSEKVKEDKEAQITKEILYRAGFECLDTYTNYIVFRKWTNDSSPLKIEIDNEENNRKSEWHVHIDNCDCDTIGTADIDTVSEFNTLMQVFESNFRI